MEFQFDKDPNFSSPDEKKKAVKRKMAWRIMILFFVIFLFLLLFIGDEIGSVYSYGASLSLSIVGIAYLYFTKNPDPIFSIGALLGSIVAQFSTWFVIGPSHYVDFLWIIICCVAAFLGANRIYATILLVLNTIGIGYFILFVQNDHFMQIQQIGHLHLTSNYLEIVLSLFILGYLMYEFMGFQVNWEKTYRETNERLKSKNQTIEIQNNQNIVLLKEIHHRVKNNLQIIVSLLRLQKHELKNIEAKAQFQEAINRVIVMSSIHQKLYRQNDFTLINLQQHLDELIQEVKSLYEHDQEVIMSVKCNIQHVDLKTMVPLGLLINELLSNSFKYAFLNRDRGAIEISIEPSKKGFTLVYKDDGIWNGEDDTNGFGLELIEVFTNQLNGNREFSTNELGTSYFFDLEYADKEVEL